MGSQLGVKSVLGLLLGPLTRPRGQGCHFGRFCCHFGPFWGVGVILVDFGFIRDAQLEPKSVLRHLVGPMAPPRGPLGAQGCHFGRFWVHFEVIFEVKIMPKSMPKINVFSSMHFVKFGCVSGCMFALLFVVFRLAVINHESPGYVKFVGNIKFLRNSSKFRVLEYALLGKLFGPHVLYFWGSC